MWSHETGNRRKTVRSQRNISGDRCDHQEKRIFRGKRLHRIMVFRASGASITRKWLGIMRSSRQQISKQLTWQNFQRSSRTFSIFFQPSSSWQPQCRRSTNRLRLQSAARERILRQTARSYIVRKSKQLVATDKGVNLIAVVPEEVKSPKLTAEWEMLLQQIEHGKASAADFMQQIAEYVKTLCTTYSKEDGSVSFHKEILHLFRQRRNGRTAYWWVSSEQLL